MQFKELMEWEKEMIEINKKEQLEKILPKTYEEVMKNYSFGVWLMSMAIANKMVEMGIFADLNAFSEYSKELWENGLRNLLIEIYTSEHFGN